MLEDSTIIEVLSVIPTATITSLLAKKGVLNTWLRGPRPIQGNQIRSVGRAFTLRFIPGREDLATPEAMATLRNTRVAIECMPPGCIVVADAMCKTDIGVLGDVLCTRMMKRGVTAFVTDGAVRDISGIIKSTLPVWSQGTSAPPPFVGLTFVNWQEPIGCGGVAVYPDDIIVADDDGVVVIPNALVDYVVGNALEQERLEEWILLEVENGAKLPGLYPPNAENLARYQSSIK